MSLRSDHKMPEKSNNRKQSVASRLTLSVNRTPSKPSQQFNPLLSDPSFVAETEQADRDIEAARQMLMHSQREAELAKKQREAAETQRKTIMMQKQVEKDNRKTKQEKARYGKTVAKSIKKTNKKNTTKGQKMVDLNARLNKQRNLDDCIITAANASETETIEQQVQRVKQKVCDLNPL